MSNYEDAALNGAADVLSRIHERAVRVAQLEAEQAADVALFAAAGGSARSVVAELALELSVTERRAGADVALAQALTTRLPETFAAFRRGEIDAFKARMVFEPTIALSDEMAGQVDAIVATRLAGKNPSSLRAAVNRVVQKVDAEGYERRSRARRRDRNVCLIHQDETMSTLLCDLPVEHASAIYISLDQEARRLRRGGESRTLEQLRADVLVDRLLNRSPGDSGIKPVVYVYVDLLTLAGLNEDPAELSGCGTVPAWLARALAADSNSVWRRIITEPDTGQVLSVGRTRYRPPAALADLVQARDRVCRHPGCRRPSQYSDIDHTHDFAQGGHTAEDNLAPYCRRHHRLKDESGWFLTTAPGGDGTITTPTGRVYATKPPPLHESRVTGAAGGAGREAAA
ncbi:HNH endonuclease [Amycolatopsis sp. NBC_00345]|uniref:HNH endonuclease signature motif containing protein n=1 Tax=Amycolatopsis sp. NBC_00345 TaxID=2975955 RepID=UPI002E257D10